MLKAFTTIAFLAALATGCKTSDGDSATKEAFRAADAQAFFANGDLQTAVFGNLPDAGAVASDRGWSSHYWPNFQGGLTHRYFGRTQSPLEKFEAVFRNQLQQDNPDYRPGDLSRLELERQSEILNRAGAARSPNWPGICDGASEAAITFPEPVGSRTVRQVTFDAFEVKALLSYFTNMSSGNRKMLFAGLRFDFQVPYLDDAGRPIDARFRDTNPGLFHLALANYLGLKHQGLVADIVPTDIVLNFPIKSFRVLNQATTNVPTGNPQAVSFLTVQTEVRFGDSHRVLETVDGVDHSFVKVYDYVLELDGDGAIIGGEWTGASVQDHPDFLWTPQELVTVEALTTSNLKANLNVGNALAELMRANVQADSVSRHRELVQHPDNLSVYRLFKDDVDPTEKAVAELPVPTPIWNELP